MAGAGARRGELLRLLLMAEADGAGRDPGLRWKAGTARGRDSGVRLGDLPFLDGASVIEANMIALGTLARTVLVVHLPASLSVSAGGWQREGCSAEEDGASAVHMCAGMQEAGGPGLPAGKRSQRLK